MAANVFQGASFLKVGGSLGPHLIILDPSLGIRSGYTNRVALKVILTQKYL